MTRCLPSLDSSLHLFLPCRWEWVWFHSLGSACSLQCHSCSDCPLSHSEACSLSLSVPFRCICCLSLLLFIPHLFWRKCSADASCLPVSFSDHTLYSTSTSPVLLLPTVPGGYLSFRWPLPGCTFLMTAFSHSHLHSDGDFLHFWCCHTHNLHFDHYLLHLHTITVLHFIPTFLLHGGCNICYSTPFHSRCICYYLRCAGILRYWCISLLILTEAVASFYLVVPSCLHSTGICWLPAFRWFLEWYYD